MVNLEKQRARNRRWRTNHPETVRENNHQWRLNNRQRGLDLNRRLRYEKMEFVREVVGSKCVDCDDDRPGAIQYHHPGGRDGIPALTDISWIRLKEDVMKIIALCGACHGVRHHKEV